jgi:hypothetical protein
MIDDDDDDKDNDTIMIYDDVEDDITWLIWQLR